MAPSGRHAWALDLTDPDTTGRAIPELPKPPGFSDAARDESVRKIAIDLSAARILLLANRSRFFPPRSSCVPQEEKIVAKKVDMMQLKLKKAKELGWSPAKNFMMTGLMLWMSGSGVHIFSIMITFYAVYNPIKSAFTVQQGTP